MTKAKSEQVKIDQLKLDTKNANRGTDRGRAMVEASLREVGAGRSILVDKDGRVIAGNKTLSAAADIGLEIQTVESDGSKLIVVQRTDLDLSDDTGAARRLAFLDNRASETGLAWDAEQILASMNDGLSFDGIFDQAELDALLAGLVEAEPVVDPGPQIDKAEELQKVWQVQTGDIWQLGKHRLACGDCTDKATVDRLMQGEKASLIATDPPYGVDFSGAKYNPRAKEWAGIDGDKRQGNDLRSWLSGMWELWLSYSDKQAAFYSWAAAMEEGAAAAGAMRDAGIHIQSQIIWNKNTLVLGQADYQWKHENCWYGFLKGEKHRWFGGRAQTTVWDISKISNSDYIHPMQKPTELYAIPIRNHTSEGMICAEPFSGSGTQIIACEQLSRQCRAIEISPAYVAVALDRFERATNTPPVRLTSSNVKL